MAKISVKLGLHPFNVQKLYTISIISKKVQDYTGGKVFKLVEKKKQVYVISGQEPVLDGWRLVAKLTFDDRFNQQALIAEVPGQTTPEEFKHTVNSQRCDHCGVERFRKVSYVVMNDQNEYKQIGSTCLGDFVRENTKEMLDYYANFWSFIDSNNQEEDEKFASGRNWSWSSEYLIAALRHIKKYGFFPAKSETPTGMMVSNIINMTREQAKTLNMLDEYDWLTDKTTEQEQAELAAILEAGKTLTGDNSFCHNVRLLCGANYWLSHEVNTMVAWIGIYLKQQVEKKINTNHQQVSKYLGVEGAKISLKFSCKSVQCYEGFYGNSWLHIGQDDQGNQVSFYSSNHLMDAGETFNIKGTIKTLKAWKEVEQTVLTRVKIM